MSTPENGNPTALAKVRPKNLLFQKVAIFVDAENIEMSSLRHHEGRTDYKKILELVGDREIVRILYYKPIYKEISQDFQNFWAGLGGEIRRPSKGADTFLVIDAVTMADKVDVAIILGGDKDFLPLVWYLRSRGCKVEIWSWPETTSPEMQQASDYYQALTEDFVIPVKPRGGGGGGGREEAPKAAPVEKSEVKPAPQAQSGRGSGGRSSGGGGSRGGGGGRSGGGRGGSGGNRGGGSTGGEPNGNR